MDDLLKTWRDREHHRNHLFISDGMVDSEAWDKAEHKILFVLKEAYDRGEMGSDTNGVIVTTAQLQVCKFDPETISIEDGKIDVSEFEEAPFLRFPKQLRTYKNDRVTPVRNERSERLLESTVFVVNASHLEEFLVNFEVTDSSANEIARYVR